MEHVSRHHPVLGTSLEVRVTPPGDPDDADAPVRARSIEDAVLAEFDRLEECCSAYRPDSAFARWRSGLIDDPGPELVDLLGLAADWLVRSAGAFHPATGAATARWRRAGVEGIEPSDDELAVLAAPSVPYLVTGGAIRRTGDTSVVDLHAIAKGWIVDRAVEVGRRAGASRLVVNAGGDLVHAGEGAVVVDVEDPLRAHDNAPPLDRVRLCAAALATSGRSRRGVRVGTRWFGHVIDPRSARPIEHVASASVIAPDAATADAIATVVGVLDPDESMAWVRGLEAAEHVACCLVLADGTVVADDRWLAARVSRDR
ncbi:MAG: FAD:protein FMN transferase [Acidimicrobiales bacterium]|nr:FAD:protein FMN transferase [Acidimicrobiales bacterium]MCB9393702.1 FAD:protein FMN transferase [Acidimicrobiaceae bacterium]